MIVNVRCSLLIIKRTLALLLCLAAAVTLGGCYQELAVRQFSKAGQQNLDGWHALPFADTKFSEKGLSLGRATFSIPLVLGEEFELRIEMQTQLQGKDIEEFGICLSQGRIYFSPVGKNLIIRTQTVGGKANYDVYNANFVIKELTYASGEELLPGFKLQGKNTLTLWKKGTSFGWNLNGRKGGPFTLPAEFNTGVYLHLNINGPMASEQAIIIDRIRVTGPKDSASAW